MKLPESKLTKSQHRTERARIDFDGKPADLYANIRYDDQCGNGHNSFAITGSVYKAGRKSNSAFIMGGCIHEIIAEHMPNLASFIKWAFVFERWTNALSGE